MKKQINTTQPTTQPPKKLVDPLETLADWLKTLGYAEEWLSNQTILNIAIEAGFDETEPALDPDCIFDTLDNAFSTSSRIEFGGWKAEYRGDGPKRQYCFGRRKKGKRNPREKRPTCRKNSPGTLKLTETVKRKEGVH